MWKLSRLRSGRTWKHQNIRREVMAVYSRAYTNRTSTKEGNHRKLNERKRKQTGNNVQRVHGICVGNPLGNLPLFIVHPPSLAVPEEYIKVEDVATLLFRRDSLHIVQVLEKNYFTNAARKRITANLLSRKPETMFTPSCTLKSIL